MFLPTNHTSIWQFFGKIRWCGTDVGGELRRGLFGIVIALQTRLLEPHPTNEGSGRVHADPLNCSHLTVLRKTLR